MSIKKQTSRLIKRTKSSLAYISKHPLTQNQLLAAYFRYFGFHFIQMFNQNKPRKFHFMNGTYFYASMGEAGIVANIYTGLADFEEMLFLLHCLEEDDLFADVGANVGAYTLLASGVCKCKTYAFEPIPSTYKKLNANIELNKLDQEVKSFNIGAGAQDSTLQFTNSPNTAMNHVVSPADTLQQETIDVKIKTLDAFFDQHRRPDLLKIDVEGFEMQVLLGASFCLSDPKLNAIIIELNHSGEKYGYSDEQVINYLNLYGFFPFSYNPFTRQLTSMNGKNMHGFNTIFIKNLDQVNSKIKVAPKRKILSSYL